MVVWQTRTSTIFVYLTWTIANEYLTRAAACRATDLCLDWISEGTPTTPLVINWQLPCSNSRENLLFDEHSFLGVPFPDIPLYESTGILGWIFLRDVCCIQKCRLHVFVLAEPVNSGDVSEISSLFISKTAFRLKVSRTIFSKLILDFIAKSNIFNENRYHFSNVKIFQVNSSIINHPQAEVKTPMRQVYLHTVTEAVEIVIFLVECERKFLFFESVSYLPNTRTAIFRCCTKLEEQEIMFIVSVDYEARCCDM